MEEKRKLTCEEVKKYIDDSVDSEMSHTGIVGIDEHLNECEKCKSYFENEEKKAFSQMIESSGKDLKKLRKRFTGKILVLVVLSVAVIYLFTSYAVPLALEQIFKTKRDDCEQFLIYSTYLTKPLVSQVNLEESKIGFSGIRLKCNYDVNVIGGGYTPNKISINVSHVSKRSKWSLEYSNFDNSVFRFYAPFYPHKNTDVAKYRKSAKIDEKWNRLEECSQGTVAQIAVTFVRPFTLKEFEDYINNIGGVDYKHSWFSVHAGDLNTYDGYLDWWGFSTNIPTSWKVERGPLSSTKDEPLMSITTDRISAAKSKIGAAAMLFEEKLEELIDYAKTIRYIDRGSVFSPRNMDVYNEVKLVNEYIKKNGILIDGAIIAASTKNLMKLKDDQRIFHMNIVKIDFDYYYN